MTEPLNASPLLAELRRVFNAQDAVALLPTPMLDMSVSTMSVDLMSTAAIADLQQQIGTLLAQATDADLLNAYQETDGEPSAPDVQTLLTEIERRNLNI